MKQLRFLPFIIALSAACNQPAPPDKIEVTGQATMKIVPDMIELSLRAYTVKPAMKDAVAETQTIVNDILRVCAKYAQAPSDIKVSNISTDKAYEYRNGKEVFTGYNALQILDVTLKDITRLERFTEELLATRITKIDNIRYNHTKADSIMREVNLLALEDARKTAEKMCTKMNVPLGKIVYLSNYQPASPDNGQGNTVSPDYDLNLYGKGFGGRGFKMTTEILQFRDVAYAGFEIRN